MFGKMVFIEVNARINIGAVLGKGVIVELLALVHRDEVVLAGTYKHATGLVALHNRSQIDDESLGSTFAAIARLVLAAFMVRATFMVRISIITGYLIATTRTILKIVHLVEITNHWYMDDGGVAVAAFQQGLLWQQLFVPQFTRLLS